MATITNSWSFIAFAKATGKPQLAKFHNSLTNEEFPLLVMRTGRTNPETGKEENILVGLSSKITLFNPAELDLNKLALELKKHKDELQVVQLDSGSFKLCEAHSNWVDVDLGI